MISPSSMKIIQIDITNACVHTCSNCTRFCGHHRKPFFMDFNTFKKAVDSLDGYTGVVGVMGGEPTLHKEFERFADYIRQKRVKNKVLFFRRPVKNLQNYVLENLMKLDEGQARVGLWCSLNRGYYKYMEVINDTFETQFLNDHQNSVEHQALLMPRKELGIPDDEWIKKRDACWIQNTWSATITPKGAFFCEVAGSLDILFNGPGGWKVEKDWWKRKPEEFKDQLHWCELCSGCLDVPKRISSDGRDDITPLMYQRLLDMGSRKAKKGLCIVHDPSKYDKTKYRTYVGADDYIVAAGNQRANSQNRNLYARKILTTCPEGLKELIQSGTVRDWILIGNEGPLMSEAESYFYDHIINPGCCYIYEGEIVAVNTQARSLREVLKQPQDLKAEVWGYYPLDKLIFVHREPKEAKEETVDLKRQQYVDSIANQLRIIEKILPYGSSRRRIVKNIIKQFCGADYEKRTI